MTAKKGRRVVKFDSTNKTTGKRGKKTDLLFIGMQTKLKKKNLHSVLKVLVNIPE